MRFTAEKQVRWRDLDQGPIILTALVLSAGIGLLPLASAQAKEREALELREPECRDRAAGAAADPGARPGPGSCS